MVAMGMMVGLSRVRSRWTRLERRRMMVCWRMSP